MRSAAAEHGSFSVISKYLATSWLWQQVRVQGGAYGGFCSFDPVSGNFSFLSYRDPNLLSTLDVYDQTGRFLREQALDTTELTRSIIGSIGALDRYQLPDAQGLHVTGAASDRRDGRRPASAAAMKSLQPTPPTSAPSPMFWIKSGHRARWS